MWAAAIPLSSPLAEQNVVDASDKLVTQDSGDVQVYQHQEQARQQEMTLDRGNGAIKHRQIDRERGRTVLASLGVAPDRLQDSFSALLEAWFHDLSALATCQWRKQLTLWATVSRVLSTVHSNAGPAERRAPGLLRKR